MADGEWVLASLGAEDGAVVEIVRDGRGVERGRHDDDAERRALFLKAF